MILFNHVGDQRLRACFGIVENIAVDVLLGASFIDHCIHRTLLTEHRNLPWHSNPVVNFLTETVTDSIDEDEIVFFVNKNLQAAYLIYVALHLQ